MPRKLPTIASTISDMPVRRPIDIWKRKLNELEAALAISANAAEKFELKEQIAEAKVKIIELGNQPDPGSAETVHARLLAPGAADRAEGAHALSRSEPVVRMVNDLAASFSYEQQLKARRAIDAIEKFALTLDRNHAARELAIRRLQEFLISSPGFDARTDVSRRLRSQTMGAIVALTNGVVGPYFRDGEFTGQDLVAMDFRNAHLAGVSFEGAFLIQSDFSHANLNGASFRNAHIRNAKFTAAEVEDADFSGADWFNAIGFTGGQLSRMKGPLLPCPVSDKDFLDYLDNHYAYSFENYSHDVQTELRAAWGACRNLVAPEAHNPNQSAPRQAGPRPHRNEIDAAPARRDLVFISYSHKDKAWHQKLRRILDADPDIRDRIWDDTKIAASADFANEIDLHVAKARVMVMLGSEPYFGPNSGAKRCETDPALEAHRNGELAILWFPVGAHSFSHSPVGHIMAATGAGAVPLDRMSRADQIKALRKVHLEVRRCLGFGTPAPSRSKKRRSDSRPRLAVERIRTERTSLMQPPVDFVIITPLEEERDAMLAHLGNPKRLPPADDDIRVYYPATVPVTFTDGSNGAYKVVLTDLLGMGRLEAANAVGDAVRRWRPKYVILVGIAGGLAKAGVRVGDVLVAEQVADYELQKLTRKKTQIRWSVHRAAPGLLAAAKQLGAGDWRPLVREQRPEPGQPQRHTGAICTGDKVIANRLMDEYREVWAKLVGVEMEAGGAASAAFQSQNAPGFFMVRGVSDLADPGKDKPRSGSWRAYACDVAAAYFEAFLKSGPVVPLSRAAEIANPK